MSCLNNLSGDDSGDHNVGKIMFTSILGAILPYELCCAATASR
ncbi:hypothetical protein FMEAI12_4630051 [Parafrankia sp. Ea1.12]|nr:hypothetical protein FMEAI12_4630051 [Parafrankia sp. Ea1.12]